MTSAKYILYGREQNYVSISETPKLSKWAESFMKLKIIEMLKISAFYLDKQKYLTYLYPKDTTQNYI